MKLLLWLWEDCAEHSRPRYIFFSKNAEKFLKTLDKQTQLHIIKKIRELQSNTNSLDIKKLKSRHTLYRLRIGNFRAIYTLEHERITIYVIAIGHRKNIYQHSTLA